MGKTYEHLDTKRMPSRIPVTQSVCDDATFVERECADAIPVGVVQEQLQWLKNDIDAINTIYIEYRTFLRPVTDPDHDKYVIAKVCIDYDGSLCEVAEAIMEMRRELQTLANLFREMMSQIQL